MGNTPKKNTPSAIFQMLLDASSSEITILLDDYTSFLGPTDEDIGAPRFTINKMNFSGLGMYLHAASIFSKKPVAFSAYMDKLLMITQESHLYGTEPSPQDRVSMAEFLISHSMFIQEWFTEDPNHRDILPLIQYIFEGANKASLNKTIHALRVPAMPLYRSAFALEFLFDLKPSEMNAAAMQWIFANRENIDFQFEDNVDLDMLKIILHEIEGIYLSLEGDPFEREALTAENIQVKLERLSMILSVLPAEIATSKLPVMISSDLSTGFLQSFGKSVTIRDMVARLGLSLSGVKHPYADEFAAVARVWQKEMIEKAQSYGGRISDSRLTMSQGKPEKSSKYVLGKIVQHAFDPQPHIIDPKILAVVFDEFLKSMMLSPVMARNIKGRIITAEDLPIVQIDKIPDSRDLPPKARSKSEYFHFYTVGFDPSKDNSHKPVVIKLQGTSGDAVEQLPDFIDEAMYQDAIIVAFNYKLSDRPSDEEIVEQIRHLTKHVAQSICNDDYSRITLHGHSLGAAPAVMTAARLKDKDGVDVAVIHDRGFSRLAYPASYLGILEPVVKATLKHYHLEMNMAKAWRILDDSQKLMLASNSDEMLFKKHNRMPKREMVLLESTTTVGAVPISSYCEELEKSPAHYSRLRSMLLATDHDVSAEHLVYQFAKKRMADQLKVSNNENKAPNIKKKSKKEATSRKRNNPS